MKTRSQLKLEARRSLDARSARHVELKQQIRTRSPRDQARKKRKLKLQKQSRSLSDSCSSSLPSQLRKDCELKQQSPARSMTDCRVSTAGTMKHSWTIEEELYLLQPLATSYDVREKYKDNKKAYRKTVANDINEKFQMKTFQYVKLDEAKVLRKFRHFSRRYKEYQQATDHIIPDPNATQEICELLEIYIAQWGWIFTDEASSVSTSSLTNSSKRKRGQDEKEIIKAAQLMADHCSNRELSLYLCALQTPSVLRGFLAKSDIQSKKKWLDDQVQLLDEVMPGWWKERMSV